MEKKLTDEEIVKALECMTGVQLIDCDNCPFMDGNFCDDFAIARNALDFIHRLQRENEQLTAFKNEAISMSLYGKGRKDGEDVAKMELEQQKAEIERLMEERDKAKRDNTSLIYNISEVEKENDELRKQVEEMKIYLASEKVCSKQAVKDTAKEILDKAIILV